jgi:hypothetical protein
MTRKEFAEWFSMRKIKTHELNVVLDTNWKLIPDYENVVNSLVKEINEIQDIIDKSDIVDDMKPSYLEALPAECTEIPLLPYRRQREYSNNICNVDVLGYSQKNPKKKATNVLFYQENHSLTEIRYSVAIPNKPIRENQKLPKLIPVGKFRHVTSADKHHDNRVYHGMVPINKITSLTPTWNVKGFILNEKTGKVEIDQEELKIKEEEKRKKDLVVFNSLMRKLLGGK